MTDNHWLTDAVRRARKLPTVFDSRSKPHDLTDLWLLYKRDQSRQALADHRAILDALVRREVLRAESLMREHVLINRDVLLRRLAATEAGSETAADGAKSAKRSSPTSVPI